MSTARHILLVDEDPAVRRQILQELAQRGHRTSEALSSSEAQVLIDKEAPSAVITEMHLGLIAHIRANIELLRMPVLVYTSLRSSADRLKALHAGADDVLAKPTSPDEIILRIERALLRAETTGLRKALKVQHSSMLGNLEMFGTASLLNLIAMERRTGVLFLEKDGQQARMAVRDGRVLNAKLTGSDGQHGAAAIYRVLHWESGSFCLTPEKVDEPDTINQPTCQLLMEGLRQQDETRKHTR